MHNTLVKTGEAGWFHREGPRPRGPQGQESAHEWAVDAAPMLAKQRPASLLDTAVPSRYRLDMTGAGKASASRPGGRVFVARQECRAIHAQAVELRRLFPRIAGCVGVPTLAIYV